MTDQAGRRRHAPADARHRLGEGLGRRRGPAPRVDVLCESPLRGSKRPCRSPGAVAAGVVPQSCGWEGGVATTEWLAGSVWNPRGVVCDASLRAAPGIFAAGMCPLGHNLFGASVRDARRHWSNAAEQGAAAAKNLLADLAGEPAQPYAPVPFFWSDQFDSRIQFVGRAHGDDEVRVVAGDLGGNFMAMYGHGGRLRGVLGVNMPKRSCVAESSLANWLPGTTR